MESRETTLITLDEILRKRDDIQATVLNLLSAFEEETGIEVDDVTLERDKMMIMRRRGLESNPIRRVRLGIRIK